MIKFILLLVLAGGALSLYGDESTGLVFEEESEYEDHSAEIN